MAAAKFRVPDWLWSSFRDLLVGLVGTALGVWGGYVLSVRQDFVRYQQDRRDAATESLRADTTAVSAINMQLQTNLKALWWNRQLLQPEVAAYPRINDYKPLSPLLDFGESGAGLRLPQTVVRSVAAREDFLRIAMLTRAVNAAIQNRDEFKRKAGLSGLVFEGSRPGDARPGDAERLVLDKDLLSRDDYLTKVINRFLLVTSADTLASVDTSP